MNSLEYCDTDNSGAFKEVDIYKHYVIKRAKNSDVDDNYISYSDGKDMDTFKDEDGNFHSSWLREHNEENGYNSDRADDDSCVEELVREFEFINKHKNIPIFVPILSGDDSEYVMPRVKTYDDYYRLMNEDKDDKDMFKKIKLALMVKINKAGGKKSPKNFNRRYDGLIRLGLTAGLNIETIVSDLYWFSFYSTSSSLLGDMHTGNIGVYKGHLVTFDAGQVSDSYDYCSKSGFRQSKDKENNLSATKEKLNSLIKIRQNEEYITLSKSIIKKEPITVISTRLNHEESFVPTRFEWHYSEYHGCTFEIYHGKKMYAISHYSNYKLKTLE